MSRRPQRPTPPETAKLRGNPGKRPPRRVASAPLASPDPPPHLEGKELELWRRLARHLVAARTLTELDAPVLEATCLAWAEYLDACKAIKDAGGPIQEAVTDRGGHSLRLHPAATIRREAWRRFVAGMVELGCTPTSRARVAEAQEASEEDEFEAFLEGGGPREAKSPRARAH